MLLVITKAEKQFIIETLEECSKATDDVDEAVEECIEILSALDSVSEEEYDSEK